MWTATNKTIKEGSGERIDISVEFVNGKDKFQKQYTFQITEITGINDIKNKIKEDIALLEKLTTIKNELSTVDYSE